MVQALPDDTENGPFIALGTWFAKPELFAGSDLADYVSIWSSGRVLVLDIAADKVRQMTRISHLIDREREAAAIPQISRRGPRTRRKREALERARHEAKVQAHEVVGLPPPPAWRPEPETTEYGEFLRSIRDHQIVPLWDLQLSGLALEKEATARVLYPDLADPNRKHVSKRSIPRGLLQKIERARELQDQAVRLVPRLRANVG